MKEETPTKKGGPLIFSTQLDPVVDQAPPSCRTQHSQPAGPQSPQLLQTVAICAGARLASALNQWMHDTTKEAKTKIRTRMQLVEL